jgi:hypothetical protein
VNVADQDLKGCPWESLTLPGHRGKTVTKRFTMNGLGLLLSEKQIPQVVENPESGDNSREALETVALRSDGFCFCAPHGSTEVRL